VSTPQPDPRARGRGSSGRGLAVRDPALRGSGSWHTASRGPASRGQSPRRQASRGPASRGQSPRRQASRGPASRVSASRGSASSLATVTRLPVRSPGLPPSHDRVGAVARRAEQKPVLDGKALAARRARVTGVLCFLILVLGAFSAAGVHAITTSEQLRLSSLQSRLQSQEALHTQLEQEVTSLSTPSRILSIAQGELHMVLPTSVTFLQAVKPLDHQDTSRVPEHSGG
jgi:cell division protein FtsL